MKSFSLAISTCPNDTFIFDALINKRIDYDNLSFNPIYADIEELNSMAIAKIPDIVKISVQNYHNIAAHYMLLTSGGAMGMDCGPLIISKRSINEQELNDCKIAIPGEHTSAYLLLRTFFPKATTTEVILFSEIESAIIIGQVDCGVIIHESRFTFQNKGLQLVADLGKIWHATFHLPLPLGAIAIKRDIAPELIEKVNTLIQNSLQYAWQNPSASEIYVQSMAQELSPDIIKSHIDLYVNQYSLSIDDTGKMAIMKMLSLANANTQYNQSNIFLPNKT